MTAQRMTFMRSKVAAWWKETGAAALAVVMMVAVCLSLFVVELGRVASGPAAPPSCNAANAYPHDDYSCLTAPAPGHASRAVPGLFVVADSVTGRRE